MHRVESILQWSVSEDLESSKKQINVSWQLYIQCHWDASQELPLGWTRHRYLPDQSIHAVDAIWFRPDPRKDDANVSYFTHESCPDTEFWFPIPLGEEEFNLSTCPMARYLHCRTQKNAALDWRTLQARNSSKTLLHTTSMLMNQENGRWAGVLQTTLGRYGRLDQPAQRPN